MQNLVYHAALHGIGPREAKRRGAGSARARRASPIAPSDKARDLSGGQMRRVEIARALLHRAAPAAARRADRRPRHQGARRHSRPCARSRRRAKASACCGPPISSTRSSRRDDVVVLHQGKMLASDKAADDHRRAGAADIGAAFERADRPSTDDARSRRPDMSRAHDAPSGRPCAQRPSARPAIRDLPRRRSSGARRCASCISASASSRRWCARSSGCSSSRRAFAQVLGVSIIPPYETYVLYEVYITPGLMAMIQLFNGMQSSLVDGL